MNEAFAVAAGAYLRLLREGKDKHQQDAANLLKVDVRTIKRWERGQNRPSIDSLSALMAWLGGDANEFGKLWENAPGTVEDAEEAIRRTLGSAVAIVDEAADEYARDLSPDKLAEIIDLAQHLTDADRNQWLDLGRHLRRRGDGSSGGR